MLKITRKITEIYIKRVESYFSFVDRAVDGCSRAHLRNRLEIARAKMNHLHTFISNFSLESRLLMVSRAYANATTNKGNVILEETMISEYHRIHLEARNRMVIFLSYQIKF